MNLETHGLTGASALTVGSHTISTAVDAAGRTTFRHAFGLRIRTGGIANRIRFDADAAHLAVTFQPRQYDARHAAPLAVLSTGGDHALNVELPVPLQLLRANFRSSVAPSGATLEVYRMDGDVRAKEATKKPADNATLSGDFTDRRFALRVMNGGSAASIGASDLLSLIVKGYPTGARVGLADAGHAEAATFFWNIPGEVGRPEGPPGDRDVGPDLARALQQRIDALEPPYDDMIETLLVVESDAPCRLDVDSFSVPYGLVRDSFRAVLFRAADITDPTAFATRLRDASTPLTQYLRGKLATATRNAIDRVTLRTSAPVGVSSSGHVGVSSSGHVGVHLAGPVGPRASGGANAKTDRGGRAIPDRVIAAIASDLNVVIQAEAIYSVGRFQGVALTPETLAAAQAAPAGVARTRVNRALLEEAFPAELAPVPEPDSDEKEVLRADGATSTLDVLVDLPRSATILSASLRVEPDLRADAPGGGSPSVADPTAWDTPIADAVGVAIDPARAVARAISPESAIDASGIAIALSATSAAAEFVAELREDRDGTPAGRILGSATATLERLDRPSWIRFTFADRVVLPARPHWIILRATDGSAIWLCDASPANTRIGEATDRAWTDRGGFTDIAPLHQLWSPAPDGNGAGGNPPDLATRIRVTIGSAVLSPTTGGPGRSRTVDIAAALQSWLSVQSGPTIAAARIQVTAAGSGSVTVHPPVVEYGLV